jgi:hypothetical protein
MATVQESFRGREEERTSQVATGGTALAEAIVGLAGVVLAIVGLAGIQVGYMLSISTIAIGAALAFEGAAIASRHFESASRVGMERFSTTESSGMSSEFAGGVAAVILGILALIGVAPVPLVSVAVIVISSALLIGTGATMGGRSAVASTGTTSMGHTFGQEAVRAAGGAEVLCGLSGVILGIVALCNVNPVNLVLVANLVLGIGIMLTGSVMSSRITALWRR